MFKTLNIRVCDAMLDPMLNAISPSTQIIIGGNINARIGTCSCKEHKQVLGPFRIARNNACGKNLLHILDPWQP
jgi:hypothetical protein